jgi:signal transduction histidine kinase
MVSLGRLLLSLFATLSVYIDPTQPTGDTALTYALLAAYALFAVAVLAGSRRIFRIPRFDILCHVIDIAFFATLIHLTDGPASPLFVYFTFVLFSGAIGWGWRGAAGTTVATVAIFLLLTAITDVDLWLHVDRIVVRISYLTVAGIFFCYFAAIVEESRLRLARLADWPAATAADKMHPPIAGILAHAAEILKLSHIVVIWRREDGTHVAAFCEGETRFDLMPEAPGLDRYAQATIIRAEEISSLLEGLPASLLTRAIAVERGVVVPLPDHNSGSCVVLLGRRRFGRDFLPLAAIVATRVAAELKHDDLRKQLIRTAAAEERAKLAQDIHDDMLQSLTAVALRLKALEARLPSGVADEVSAVRDLVTLQQRRLRELVMETGSASRGADGSFAGRMKALAAMLRAQWACVIELELQPGDLPLPEATIRNVELFVTEAVANGVRHGHATRFEIGQRIAQDWLELSIRDDGRGIEGSAGAYDHEAIMHGRLGSNSLRQRAQALGWRIQLATSAGGTQVVVQVPFAEMP